MAKLGPHRISVDALAPPNGRGAGDGPPVARHCALCGQAVPGPGPAAERFGEPFCSEEHAEQFVAEVRAARVQAAAITQDAPQADRLAVPGDGAPEPREAPKARDRKAYLGKAICWGAPLLAVVILLGGGSQGLGAASGLLPVLAFLACPLGMYLMMRSMTKMGDRENRGDKPGGTRSLDR